MSTGEKRRGSISADQSCAKRARRNRLAPEKEEWERDLSARQDAGDVRSAFSIAPCPCHEVPPLSAPSFPGIRHIEEHGLLLCDGQGKVNVHFLLATWADVMQEESVSCGPVARGHLEWLVQVAIAARIISSSEVQNGKVAYDRISSARRRGSYSLLVEGNLIPEAKTDLKDESRESKTEEINLADTRVTDQVNLDTRVRAEVTDCRGLARKSFIQVSCLMLSARFGNVAKVFSGPPPAMCLEKYIERVIKYSGVDWAIAATACIYLRRKKKAHMSVIAFRILASRRRYRAVLMSERSSAGEFRDGDSVWLQSATGAHTASHETITRRQLRTSSGGGLRHRPTWHLSALLASRRLDEARLFPVAVPPCGANKWCKRITCTGAMVGAKRVLKLACFLVLAARTPNRSGACVFNLPSDFEHHAKTGCGHASDGLRTVRGLAASTLRIPPCFWSTYLCSRKLEQNGPLAAAPAWHGIYSGSLPHDGIIGGLRYKLLEGVETVCKGYGARWRQQRSLSIAGPSQSMCSRAAYVDDLGNRV